MPHCFLVNHSVFFIPREDKALPSIQILFTELWSYLPSRPARDNRPRFFVFISVITVSAYHDQHVIILSKNRMKMKNRQSYEIYRGNTFDFDRHTGPKYTFQRNFHLKTAPGSILWLSYKQVFPRNESFLSRGIAACVTWLRAIQIESASRLFTSLYNLSIDTIFDPPYLSLKNELKRRFITNLAFTLTVSVIEIETIKHRDFRLSYVRFACLTLSSM